MPGSTSPVYMATRITVVLLLSWLTEIASVSTGRYEVLASELKKREIKSATEGVAIVGRGGRAEEMELITSGCTKYGHACWGGHGKRSGGVTARDINPSSGGIDGPAMWAPSDYVLARVASGGPLAALLDVSASEAATRTRNPRQPSEYLGDLTASDEPGRTRTGHRMRSLGSPAVDMISPSAVGGAPSSDVGQDDDEASAPRDLLVMGSGEPDQEQLHLYKILNRSTRKVN